MRLTSIFLLLLITWPSVGQARCTNPQTQTEMNQCAGLDLARATDEINATYADLRRHLPKEQREEIRQVQLAWITYKDRNCRLESRYAEGGSLQPMIRDVCLTRITEQRNKELKELRILLAQ